MGNLCNCNDSIAGTNCTCGSHCQSAESSDSSSSESSEAPTEGFEFRANRAVRKDSVKINGGSSRLYAAGGQDAAELVEACKQLCAANTTCYGFVHNREKTLPYCVFKGVSASLGGYNNSAKDLYAYALELDLPNPFEDM